MEKTIGSGWFQGSRRPLSSCLVIFLVSPLCVGKVQLYQNQIVRVASRSGVRCQKPVPETQMLIKKANKGFRCCPRSQLCCPNILPCWCCILRFYEVSQMNPDHQDCCPLK